jgi:hypothetical protein
VVCLSDMASCPVEWRPSEAAFEACRPKKARATDGSRPYCKRRAATRAVDDPSQLVHPRDIELQERHVRWYCGTPRLFLVTFSASTLVQRGRSLNTLSESSSWMARFVQMFSKLLMAASRRALLQVIKYNIQPRIVHAVLTQKGIPISRSICGHWQSGPDSRSRLCTRPNRETGIPCFPIPAESGIGDSLPVSRPNREWGERELGTQGRFQGDFRVCFPVLRRVYR